MATPHRYRWEIPDVNATVLLVWGSKWMYWGFYSMIKIIVIR